MHSPGTMTASIHTTVYEDDSDVIHQAVTSSATSFSSDKENRSLHYGQKHKRTPRMAEEPDNSSRKRRRLDVSSQTTHKQTENRITDTQYYDPDQNVDDRRKVRKGIRELQKEFTG